jgi:uncharacterized protein YecE (DUF72 family)
MKFCKSSSPPALPFLQNRVGNTIAGFDALLRAPDFGHEVRPAGWPGGGTRPIPLLTFAPQVILHFVVIARKIKNQSALLRLKHQSPRQTRAALVKMVSQFPDGQPAVRVRLAETFRHQLQSG